MICERCRKLEAEYDAPGKWCEVCWRFGWFDAEIRRRPGQWGYRARLLRAWRKKRADERRGRSATLARFGWARCVAGWAIADDALTMAPRLSGEDIVFSQENAISIVAWERSADESGRAT